MSGERKQIRRQITEIGWFMRGGITRQEAWNLSYFERKDIVRFIDQRVKFMEKSGLPIL